MIIEKEATAVDLHRGEATAELIRGILAGLGDLSVPRSVRIAVIVRVAAEFLIENVGPKHYDTAADYIAQTIKEDIQHLLKAVKPAGSA